MYFNGQKKKSPDRNAPFEQDVKRITPSAQTG